MRNLFVLPLAMVAGAAQASTLDLSPVPLYLGGAIEPNVMFTLDDSGSMYWSYMPDDISGDRTTHRAKAPEFNAVYYNPRVTYDPPVDAYGNPYPDASFTAAWNDGYAHLLGDSTCTVNLSSDYRPTWYYGNNCNSDYSEYSGREYAGGPEPAYYYIYYTNHPAGPKPKPSGCSDSLNDDDCYLKVVVGSTSGVDGVDERTNFANWYSYYRRRIYAAKAAIGMAFAAQGTGMRVGYGAINNPYVDIDGVSTYTLSRGVRSFSGSEREAFFDFLYGEQATGYTPLRWAAYDVGEYFSRKDAKGPWSETPGVSGGSDHSCRQSYHVLMSDGYWNDAFYAGSSFDPDSTDGPTHPHPSDSSKDFTFVAESPFKDDQDNTLADLAMEYWKNDLHDSLADEVPTSPQDPAFWQHLVTYTVGLGVSGNIDPDEAFDAIGKADSVTIAWPKVTYGSPGPDKIDDMLHAAVNSRGGFFSAKDPEVFAEALGAILADIVDRNSSASSVALNSGSLYGGSYLFQAKFNTEKWSGEVLAYAINSDGSIDSTPKWNAAELIPGPSARRILTYDPGAGAGIPFQWGSLTTAQKADLDNDSTILDFLRGDRSNESPSGPLRKRESLLGDIINSAPLYVGPPSAGYPSFWGSSEPENAAPYSDFMIDHSGRTPVVYVASNDGMLHVFNADSGEELFAYVPGMLFPRLKKLSEPGYAHEYYADGTPVVVDAFFSSDSAWHSVLVAGLNGGGQGIYALDVTTLPTETTAESDLADKVLWEFTDADDADLGFTFSRPNVVRLANGQWAAVFGNGYNNTKTSATDTIASSTGNAVLYIVNIEDGSLIKKIDTKTGSAEDPTGANRPNGLSTVAPVDVDGDYIVDYVYGGDLFGNLWKFDLTGSMVSKWGIPYGTSTKPKPLFVARSDASDATTAQPITVRPAVGRHPGGYGFMVYFGTGKYFEVGDNKTTGENTQTFYAVWDQNDISPEMVIGRSDLLQQEILDEVAVDGFEYRLTSDSTGSWDDPNKSGVTSGSVLGWYMDLYNTNFGTTTANHGERQVTDPLLRGDRIIFTTLLPSDSPCEFGGSGWLMELDAAWGAHLPFTPFDTDHDGVFSSSDEIETVDSSGTTVSAPASGKKSTVGILPAPAVIADVKNQQEFKYESGSSGEIEVTKENPGPGSTGRTSWLELIDE